MLDALNQGIDGIGLNLCRKLIYWLMGGKIWPDEAYRSDVEGCPGARFVIELNTHSTSSSISEFLPEKLSGLFGTG
jgi:hypothetical protein